SPARAIREERLTLRVGGVRGRRRGVVCRTMPKGRGTGAPIPPITTHCRDGCHPNTTMPYRLTHATPIPQCPTGSLTPPQYHNALPAHSLPSRLWQLLSAVEAVAAVVGR